MAKWDDSQRAIARLSDRTYMIWDLFRLLDGRIKLLTLMKSVMGEGKVSF